MWKNFELLLLAGATLLPANPSFYSGAKTITDLVDASWYRACLDHMGIANKLAPLGGGAGIADRG